MYNVYTYILNLVVPLVNGEACQADQCTTDTQCCCRHGIL